MTRRVRAPSSAPHSPAALSGGASAGAPAPNWRDAIDPTWRDRLPIATGSPSPLTVSPYLFIGVVRSRDGTPRAPLLPALAHPRGRAVRCPICRRSEVHRLPVTLVAYVRARCSTAEAPKYYFIDNRSTPGDPAGAHRDRCG